MALCRIWWHHKYYLVYYYYYYFLAQKYSRTDVQDIMNKIKIFSQLQFMRRFKACSFLTSNGSHTSSIIRWGIWQNSNAFSVLWWNYLVSWKDCGKVEEASSVCMQHTAQLWYPEIAAEVIASTRLSQRNSGVHCNTLTTRIHYDSIYKITF